MVVASSSGMPVHRAVEIANWHRTVDHHGAVRLGADARHHHVVLVGDIADDLFQDVLQRHHAFDFAVLVDNKREVGLAAAERLELFGHRPHLRHKPRRQRDGRDVDLAGIAVGGADRANRSLACSTPTMFSGFSRHSGIPVYSVASTSRTSSSGGRSALIITISVRWTITSETCTHADPAAPRTCRGPAFRPCPHDAADRPRRAGARSATGSAGWRRS